MPIRVVVLWHMHQPYYKDLISGQYRLPWVRLHALKDYFGMVKVLEEFPQVHQTFNLAPSLIMQIGEYCSGAARDPFFDVAAKPAAELDRRERQFALEYLFQANPAHMIGRYPRYAELQDQFRSRGCDPVRGEALFSDQDFTDLQVLSQLAWFDEFFLEDADVASLIAKGRNFSLADQDFVISRERALLARVLPAYCEAAARGQIEISTSPFYHPILPLLCDTDMGAISCPGLPLPQARFRHPEDARSQLERGLALHEQVFGQRPRGVWPSEGSVSEEVLAIAASLGVQWMASDEGVLGRSLNLTFPRDETGSLSAESARRLYSIHRYERGGTAMHLLFRDHALSDLIGFVYSSMNAADSAAHLIARIKASAQPLLGRGVNPVVPIILDGENAWEFYPRSGREFLRRFYAALEQDGEFEALTVSEAIARQHSFSSLRSLTPGSWINANFNVWIGAPEDNRAWDCLSEARDFFTTKSPGCTPGQRALAEEELFIAEGSDWNWWYGPEHHSANDRDFDEIFRAHVSNVYAALGASPPEYLAQPILRAQQRAYFVPQSGFIHPQIDTAAPRYFDWVGAATYTAERTGGSMHGAQFFLRGMLAGVDEAFLYVRLEFLAGCVPVDSDSHFSIAASLESSAPGSLKTGCAVRLMAEFRGGRLESVCFGPAEAASNAAAAAQGAAASKSRNMASASFELSEDEVTARSQNGAQVSLRQGFAARIPLAALKAEFGGKLRVRFSLWRDRLPLDALPAEGSIELDLLSDRDFAASSF